jgi:hypothetical protein
MLVPTYNIRTKKKFLIYIKLTVGNKDSKRDLSSSSIDVWVVSNGRKKFFKIVFLLLTNIFFLTQGSLSEVSNIYLMSSKKSSSSLKTEVIVNNFNIRILIEAKVRVRPESCISVFVYLPHNNIIGTQRYSVFPRLRLFSSV